MSDSDPFSDIDRTSPPAVAGDPRRRAPRRRVLKTATIMTLNNMSVVSCTLRDMSETGARLRCLDQASVPKEFYLVFPVENTRCLARVVWRRGDEIGIQFVSEKEAAPRRKG
jgi:two-component system cell cycle response regulator